MDADSAHLPAPPSEAAPRKAGLPARTRAIALLGGAAGIGLLDLLALDDLLTNSAGSGPLELAFLVASVPALITLVGLLRGGRGEADPPDGAG